MSNYQTFYYQTQYLQHIFCFQSIIIYYYLIQVTCLLVAMSRLVQIMEHIHCNANLTRNDCIKTCVESGNEFAGFEVKPILFFLIFKPGTIELEKFKQSSRVEI